MKPDDSNSDARFVLLPADYPRLLEEIKARVHASRIRAAVSVNRELILLVGVGTAVGRLQAETVRGPKSFEEFAAKIEALLSAGK